MDRRLFLEGSLAAGVATLAGVASASPVTAVSDVYANDRIAIRVGLGLVRPMFRREAPNQLVVAIQNLRRELSESGIALPPVRIRDLPSLPPDAFLIVIDGRVLARESISKQQLLDAEGHVLIMNRLVALVEEHSSRFAAQPDIPPGKAMASQPSAQPLSAEYCWITN